MQQCRFQQAAISILLAFAATLLFVPAAHALKIDLDRPGDREFVRDMANLIDDGDVTAIKQQCDQLLTDTATPIIVVTIENMATHGGEDLRIETFARLLFDQWEIGHAKINGQNWNTGILLLVSRGDRRARIELGAGWGREKDSHCLQIMDQQIIPRFKAGDFSAGIAAGVNALDQMARGKPLPRAPARPKPPWFYPAVLGCIALAIFTGVSLYRRGSSGWAWLLWGLVFTAIGAVLYSLATSSGSSGGGGGGGFSGGSFGGGFSGGGGASGSW